MVHKHWIHSFLQEYSDNECRVIILSSMATISMVFGIISIMPVVPKLMEVFEVDLKTASLVIAAYAIPGVFLAPVAGLLADRFGRRFVLAPAFFLFSIAGTACAFAPDLYWLIGLRFIQGIGAAPLQALNITILGDTFTGNMRARWIGYNMTIVSVCNAVYPFLGGLLAQWHWRLPFLLPVLALPVACMTLRTQLLAPEKGVPLSAYAQEVWHILSGKTLAYLLMTLCAFFLLFSCVITGYPALASTLFTAEPVFIGLLMTVFSLGLGVCSARFGWLSERVQVRTLLLGSISLYALSIVLMPLMPSFYWLILPLLLFGCAHAVNVPCVQALLVQSAVSQQRGAVMSVNSMLTRVGQSSGPYIFGVLVERGNFTSAYWLLLCVIGAFFILALAAPVGMLHEHEESSSAG